MSAPGPAFRHRSADMNTLVAVGTGAAFLYSVRRHRGARLLPRARRGAGRLLRGGGHHHRPDPHRQRLRGAGQEPHLGRAARAGRPAAEDGAGAAAADAGDATCRSSRCGAATRWSSARASGCRWTARCSRAPARSTSRCSPASRCRSRSRPGDRVIGGTINRTGAFRYRATTLGSDSVLAQIVRLMRDAQGSRAPIQRLADRISGDLRAGGDRRSPSPPSWSGTAGGRRRPCAPSRRRSRC